MKMELKPWQIGLIAAAGVVVLGGAGTGIYFGVNRSIDDKVKEQVDAAMESMYSSEAALDESETPSQVPTDEPETEKSTSVIPQTAKESETVLITTPNETTPSTNVPSETISKNEIERSVSLSYDVELSYIIVNMMREKNPGVHYTLMPSNYVSEQEKYFEKELSNNSFPPSNNQQYLFKKYDAEPSATDIFTDWNLSDQKESCGIIIWKAVVDHSNERWVFAFKTS